MTPPSTYVPSQGFALIQSISLTSPFNRSLCQSANQLCRCDIRDQLAAVSSCLNCAVPDSLQSMYWVNLTATHRPARPRCERRCFGEPVTLTLMDNYGSHYPEFTALANENHIRPHPLIPHLTHGLQPLDGGGSFTR